MICMNDLNSFVAEMSSSNPDFASLFAQQQLLATNAALSSQQSRIVANVQPHQPHQASSSASNSTSPLQQQQIMNYLLQQQMMNLKQQMGNQVAVTTVMTSSAPSSQKPSFSFTPVSEEQMMKFIQNSASTGGLIPSAVQNPQQKAQAQFILANVQSEDKKSKMDSTNAAGLHHPSPVHPSPQQQQLTSPASTAATLSLQHNAHPQLKRTQPMTVPGMPPFNIIQPYQEHLNAMNGPPPAKRHSISSVPSHNQSQAPTALAHPLATLPMLQGALNPHFASALSNAQSQQTINGLAKGAHAPSILQIPTIPPAFVATAPIRQNGQEVNGMGSMSMQNPQIVGLPDGINIQHLQQLFMQQRQGQIRLNGSSAHGQIQLPISAAQLIQPTPQTQQSMAQASLAQNPAQLQQLLFQQHMMQQQKAALGQQQAVQLQQMLNQQQAANAAMEQQRRRSTIGNPTQLNVGISQPQQPPFGGQLAALMVATQRNSPMHHGTTVTNSSPASGSVNQIEDSTSQPPKLQRITPPGSNGQLNGSTNQQEEMQKLMSQINPAGLDINQQQLFLHQLQQQQLAQNRIFQLQQQFVESQNAIQNPIINTQSSFANSTHPVTTTVSLQLANPIPIMAAPAITTINPQNIQSAPNLVSALTTNQPSTSISNGTSAKDDSPVKSKHSSVVVPATSTETSLQTPAVSRESVSADDCLIIADEEDHPVVD